MISLSLIVLAILSSTTLSCGSVVVYLGFMCHRFQCSLFYITLSLSVFVILFYGDPPPLFSLFPTHQLSIPPCPQASLSRPSGRWQRPTKAQAKANTPLMKILELSNMSQ